MSQPTYLNAAQRRILTDLLDQYSQDRLLDPGDRLRLEMMAAVIYEIRHLQKFINKHGTTYQVVGRSGDIYSKHRPEHQQLVEARHRLHIMAGAIAKDAQPIETSIEDLLNPSLSKP